MLELVGYLELTLHFIKDIDLTTANTRNGIYLEIIYLFSWFWVMLELVGDLGFTLNFA